jgi:DNA-binding GntR family transcriptional regulator
MQQSKKTRNLNRSVSEAVRAAVLAGRLAPGERLSPRVLATEHNVSLSVAREALTRLSEQGLVASEHHRGFSVVTLDIDDMRDLYRLRILIEGTAFRDAVENGDLDYEAAVVASHHRLERTHQATSHGSRETSEAWSLAHREFHRQLLSASTSSRLRDLADRLRQTSELYRRWSETLTDGGASRDVVGEHRALVEAVLAHDADLAVTVLSNHINTTLALLEQYAADHTAAPAPRSRT